MKKKIMAAFLCSLLIAGCGNTSNDTQMADTQVVYYSATGNTANAANVMAQETGADVLELESVEVYTQEDLNWTNDDSRVSVEHDNPDDREVELTTVSVSNWEEYETLEEMAGTGDWMEGECFRGSNPEEDIVE